MTADDFTTAARAEAVERYEADPDYIDSFVAARLTAFMAGAVWARDHLAAQEETDAQINAAALVLCRGDRGGVSCMNFDDSVHGGCSYCTEDARAALAAARAVRQEKR